MKTGYLFIILCIAVYFITAGSSAEAYSGGYYSDTPIVSANNCEGTTEQYPVIGMMELKVLGNAYPTQDIYQRLNRLELAIFGTVSQKCLSDRMDLLSNAVFGENNNPRYEDSYPSYNTAKSYSGTGYGSSSGNDSLSTLLFQIEQEMFNRTYPNETTEQRISRLETYIFNETSSNYPTEERLQRIASVVKAQSSDDLYKDTAQLNKMQNIGQGVSIVAIILMIIAGLVL